MDHSDEELVRKCQRGDQGAFQELVSRYYQRIYKMILGLLRDRDDALEASQETFLRAHQKIKSFRGGSSFYTWLYRIAFNMVIDARRKQKRSPLALRQSLDTVPDEQIIDEKDPFAELRDKQLGERILAAINQLTPEQRAVIILRTVEGLSYREIGKVLRCSEGTVMSRLHYARKKLQNILDAFL